MSNKDSKSYYNLEEVIKRESKKKNAETLGIIEETKATLVISSGKIKDLLDKLDEKEISEDSTF